MAELLEIGSGIILLAVYVVLTVWLPLALLLIVFFILSLVIGSIMRAISAGFAILLSPLHVLTDRMELGQREAVNNLLQKAMVLFIWLAAFGSVGLFFRWTQQFRRVWNGFESSGWEDSAMGIFGDAIRLVVLYLERVQDSAMRFWTGRSLGEFIDQSKDIGPQAFSHFSRLVSHRFYEGLQPMSLSENEFYWLSSIFILAVFLALLLMGLPRFRFGKDPVEALSRRIRQEGEARATGGQEEVLLSPELAAAPRPAPATARPQDPVPIKPVRETVASAGQPVPEVVPPPAPPASSPHVDEAPKPLVADIASVAQSVSEVQDSLQPVGPHVDAAPSSHKLDVSIGSPEPEAGPPPLVVSSHIENSPVVEPLSAVAQAGIGDSFIKPPPTIRKPVSAGEEVFPATDVTSKVAATESGPAPFEPLLTLASQSQPAPPQAGSTLEVAAAIESETVASHGVASVVPEPETVEQPVRRKRKKGPLKVLLVRVFRFARRFAGLQSPAAAPKRAAAQPAAVPEVPVSAAPPSIEPQNVEPEIVTVSARPVSEETQAALEVQPEENHDEAVVMAQEAVQAAPGMAQETARKDEIASVEAAKPSSSSWSEFTRPKRFGWGLQTSWSAESDPSGLLPPTLPSSTDVSGANEQPVVSTAASSVEPARPMEAEPVEVVDEGSDDMLQEAVELVASPIASFTKLLAMERYLTQNPIIKSCFIRNFTRGTATIELRLAGRTRLRELEGVLANLRDYPLKLERVSDGRIEVKVQAASRA